MTPEELEEKAVKAFGSRGWQSKLAAHLGVNRSTVWRWSKGAMIKKVFADAISALPRRLNRKGP